MSIQLCREYLKENKLLRFKRNENELVFCAAKDCETCTIQEICPIGTNLSGGIRPSITNEELQIIMQEFPEYFI